MMSGAAIAFLFEYIPSPRLSGTADVAVLDTVMCDVVNVSHTMHAHV